MNARKVFRLLIAVFTSVSFGFMALPVSAAQNTSWSDTDMREDVLVQDCHGASVVSGYSPALAFGFDFEITTSYMTVRKVSTFGDYTGIDPTVMELQQVSFLGAAANTKTGFLVAYDGEFTQTMNYHQGQVSISDLTLHLAPVGQEKITVTVDRDDSGPIDSPEALLLAYASRGLNTSLCSYFAGLKVAG
jgi:hypothetical protein